MNSGTQFWHFTIAGLFVGIIYGFFFVVSCDEPTNIEPVSKPILYEPCEKDGIVHIILKEYVNDTTSCIIDSLAISETLNAVDMTNAIEINIPQTEGIEFFFSGNFVGMENEIGIWHNNYIEKETYIKYSTNFDIVRHNRGVVYLLDLNNTIIDTSRMLQAYAVAFDDDEDHSGEGQIIVTTSISSDTFQIDASRNTVNYLEKASRLNFQLSESTIVYDLFCRDIESFKILKHDAIWMLRRREDPSIIAASTSRSGYGMVNEVNEREFILYGFAPIFERSEK